MRPDAIKDFVSNQYRRSFAAEAEPRYPVWRGAPSGAGDLGAALGHRCAADAPLFLEAYLDEPIEAAVSRAFSRQTTRDEIVEIGCLASTSAPALIRLWKDSATDFADRYTFAVATLTQSLRTMFRRIGLRIIVLAPADPSRIEGSDRWGSYYEDNPMVCAGLTRAGALSLGRFRQANA